ncbi:phosphate/phosphite/phosphonate ABC transporter substrate-binding protein [Vibrio gigantis]
MKNLTLLILALLPTLTYADTFTFGIVPQQSASRLAQQWTPILAKISQETGHTIIFETAKDIPMFEQRLASGDYDFAYMNPFHFVTFNNSVGYSAMAKAKDKRLKGIMVVRKDSGITSLDQLDNSTLAFPAPAAFAATLLTQAGLKQRNVHFEPNYVSSHDSVYLSVAKGFYPSGGGIIRTFNALDPEVRDQLTPIYTSKGFTPHAIANHPRVDSEVVQKVQTSFVQLAQNEEGKTLLSPLRIKAFETAVDVDWDDVRALNIKQKDTMPMTVNKEQ